MVALPFVGTLGWRCSPFGASSRFTTGLVLPRPGATVYADLWADGRRVWRHRQIDPLPDPSLTLITNTPPALHRQTWRLRYHHATATMTALVRMRFHVNEDEARCFVSPVDVTTRRR